MRKRTALWLGGLLMAFLVAGSAADAAGPEVGTKAPAFELQRSDGGTTSLEEHLGKQDLVLAWFPKAFTPG